MTGAGHGRSKKDVRRVDHLHGEMHIGMDFNAA